MIQPLAIPFNGPATDDDLHTLAVRVLGDLATIRCEDTREDVIYLALQIAFHGGRWSALKMVADAQQEVLSATSPR